MTYHMSRVRGHDVFHLQVTRDTSVQALCLWLGIDPRDLLTANPGLESEQLLSGEKLVIPAHLLAADNRGNSLLFGEWPQTVKVEEQQDTPAADDDESTNGQRVSEPDETDDAVPGEGPMTDNDGKEDTSVDNEQMLITKVEMDDVGQHDTATQEDDGIDHDAVAEETPVLQEQDLSSQHEPTVSAEKKEESIDEQQSAGAMMWRPFPKSDL